METSLCLNHFCPVVWVWRCGRLFIILLLRAPPGFEQCAWDVVALAGLSVIDGDHFTSGPPHAWNAGA